VGTLNYQVENGGFSQWVCNGYDACADELGGFLRRLPYAGPQVARIVSRIARCTDEEKLDTLLEEFGEELDERYYDLGDALLFEVEAVLRAHPTDSELETWMTR
jgi:hypothetical protein